MADAALLPAGDIKSIAKALLDWLRTCPDIPSDLKLTYQNLDNDSGMSLHTLRGTVKRTEYVDGGYEGYYPFAIYLRDVPDSTNTRLQCSSILDTIGSWVDEQRVYPDITDDISVSEINWVANATLVKRFESGIEDYMATFELIFEKE